MPQTLDNALHWPQKCGYNAITVGFQEEQNVVRKISWIMLTKSQVSSHISHFL